MDLCTDVYANKPQTFWGVMDNKVSDINANWDVSEHTFVKFGITWGEVLDYTGKSDISTLSDQDVKRAMLAIVDATSCVYDWYNEL